MPKLPIEQYRNLEWWRQFSIQEQAWFVEEVKKINDLDRAFRQTLAFPWL